MVIQTQFTNNAFIWTNLKLASKRNAGLRLTSLNANMYLRGGPHRPRIHTLSLRIMASTTGLERLDSLSNEFLRRTIGGPRIVKTEGIERLFKHYTGLEGEELMNYLKDFQAQALAVPHRLAS
jgi:hypothetical protein